MDKTDLIYDTVTRIEDRLLKELCECKKDIDDLKKFKNTLIGFGIVISSVFAFIIDSVKNIFKG
jgi:putative NADH-flavin reductase